MCVAKNTSQTANVEFDRFKRANYALQQAASPLPQAGALWQKAPKEVSPG